MPDGRESKVEVSDTVVVHLDGLGLEGGGEGGGEVHEGVLRVREEASVGAEAVICDGEGDKGACCGDVGGTGGQGKGGLEVGHHIHSKGRQGRMGVGLGAAARDCARKACIKTRESAVMLCVLGRCCAESVKLCLAAM